jgi:hypothetical protein
MYAVVIQKGLKVEKVISCDTLLNVQLTLETIEPDLDAKYLTSGEDVSVLFNETTYSVLDLKTYEQELGLDTV